MSGLGRAACALAGVSGLVLGTLALARTVPGPAWWAPPLIAISAVLTLAGLGRWRQPLYLLVILSVPVGFALSRVLPAGIPVGVVVGVLGGTAAVVAFNVYRDRSGPGGDPPRRPPDRDLGRPE